ncbi:hypothetical protein Tco_0261816 [Tanacetum coccineum]
MKSPFIHIPSQPHQSCVLRMIGPISPWKSRDQSSLVADCYSLYFQSCLLLKSVNPQGEHSHLPLQETCDQRGKCSEKLSAFFLLSQRILVNAILSMVFLIFFDLLPPNLSLTASQIPPIIIMMKIGGYVLQVEPEQPGSHLILPLYSNHAHQERQEDETMVESVESEQQVVRR